VTEQPLERDAEAAFEPFQTRHLLGLIAAVAVVLYSQWLIHNGLPRVFLSPPGVSTIVHSLQIIVSSVVEASLSFVSLVALALLRRYRHDKFWEPGHSIALRGAAVWLFSVITYGGYTYALQTPIPRLLAIVQLAAAVAFVLWFLWLSLFSRGTPAWKRAYLLLAIAPALGAAASMANMWFDSGLGPPRNFKLMELTRAAVALTQGVAVAIAAANDIRHALPRHWSHWIAVAASLAGFALSLGVALWMATLVSG
jgi:hypothetical protein